MSLNAPRPFNPHAGENMVSNLPLLFAAGYPTSLDKINASQLEKFIPFMVQCSLGQIHISNLADCTEPEWWPDGILFSIPLKKPAQLSNAEWLSKLRNIVAICYNFHNSVFLLRFCENLSSYQPENLRFINNFNSTTSLFDRLNNKLLVTFRNENMLYDQIPVNPKKTLLPRTHSSQALEGNSESMVEQTPFDIYLCDNCEAELYSLEAYKEHEKGCRGGYESEDDDVMIIEQDDEPTMQQANFLQNFQLASTGISREQQINHFHHNNNNNNNNSSSVNNNAIREIPSTSDKKVKRVTRRTHVTLTLSKCPLIPFSSPAGQQLIKTANGQITNQVERWSRVERWCQAPPLNSDGSNRPKFLDKKIVTCVPITYRRSTASLRYYTFPQRQCIRSYRREQLRTLQKILLKENHCRPVDVRLRRLTDEDIEKMINDVKISYQERPHPIKIARRTRVIDFIDLCSSGESSEDEDDERDEQETEGEQIIGTDDGTCEDRRICPVNFVEFHVTEEMEADDNDDDDDDDGDDDVSEPNNAQSPDSNGTKENINYNAWNHIQITKGNQPIDLNSLRRSMNSNPQISAVPSHCDSNANQFGSDAIQNLLNNRQSISLIRNRPLQHQNQDNSNATRYLNVRMHESAEQLLFGKAAAAAAANNEITITRKPATVTTTASNTNPMQPSNFISIDLTL